MATGLAPIIKKTFNNLPRAAMSRIQSRNYWTRLSIHAGARFPHIAEGQEPLLFAKSPSPLDWLPLLQEQTARAR